MLVNCGGWFQRKRRCTPRSWAARSNERTYRHFGHRHPEPSAKLNKLDVKSPPLEVEVLKNERGGAPGEQFEPWRYGGARQRHEATSRQGPFDLTTAT